MITIRCFAHFIKILCKNVDRRDKNDYRKKNYEDLLAATVLIHDLNFFDSFVINIYLLMNSNYMNITTKDAENN